MNEIRKHIFLPNKYNDFLIELLKISRAEIDSGSETIINEVHNQEINVRQ